MLLCPPRWHHYHQTVIWKQPFWIPTALSGSFITQQRKMSSGSSSTRLLVPHQSDGNSGLSKPKNYPSMLHGHFDTKSSFLSKSTFSTGLPEPELRGVIFSCNGLKLGLMVMVWEELAGVFTISLPPQILHAINTRKYANFNLKEQQQQ